jgi:hypothetical protein
LRRPVVLALSVTIAFLVTVAVMWQVMPYPRKDLDYLIMGAAATMVSMVVLFLVLINTTYKRDDVFFKRRK